MKTLVIPDVHNHTTEVEALIARYPADRVVFLGDYFDSFDDNPGIASDTAHWLKASLARPERLHLWGNHDLWYRFPKNSQICWVGSGFTHRKHAEISKILTVEDWSQLRLVEFVDDIALSHAGICDSVFGHPMDGLTRDRIESMCADALRDAETGIDNEVFGESGIVWLRWWNLEVAAGFSQFVGHTVGRDLRIESDGVRCNVCIDTMGRYLGLIEDGVMSVIDDFSGQVAWRQGESD